MIYISSVSKERFSPEIIHKLGRANQISLERLPICTQAQLTREGRSSPAGQPGWLSGSKPTISLLGLLEEKAVFTQLSFKTAAFRSATFMNKAKSVCPLLLCHWVLFLKYIKREYMGIWSLIWTCLMLGMSGNSPCMRENHLAFPHLTLPSPRVNFCSEAKRIKTLPLEPSCINRDTVTNASFNTGENFRQLFILSSTEKSLKFSTQQPLQSKWITPKQFS